RARRAVTQLDPVAELEGFLKNSRAHAAFWLQHGNLQRCSGQTRCSRVSPKTHCAPRLPPAEKRKVGLRTLGFVRVLTRRYVPYPRGRVRDTRHRPKALFRSHNGIVTDVPWRPRSVQERRPCCSVRTKCLRRSTLSAFRPACRSRSPTGASSTSARMCGPSYW